jgi:hypothetical protein
MGLTTTLLQQTLRAQPSFRIDLQVDKRKIRNKPNGRTHVVRGFVHIVFASCFDTFR